MHYAVPTQKSDESNDSECKLRLSLCCLSLSLSIDLSACLTFYLSTLLLLVLERAAPLLKFHAALQSHAPATKSALCAPSAEPATKSARDPQKHCARQANQAPVKRAPKRSPTTQFNARLSKVLRPKSVAPASESRSQRFKVSCRRSKQSSKYCACHEIQL